jgi:PAS domain S-box-containing protein
MGFLSRAQKFEHFDFDSKDLVKAIKNPFLILDLTGRIVFANDEFLIISGYDRRELINKEAIDIFEMPSNWRLKLGPSKDSKRIGCHLIRHDGEKHPILITLSEICRKGQQVKNLMCAVNDEQEYERMEARIKAEARRFSGLYDTSVALSGSLEMKDVLETVAKAAETLTDSDTCTVFALDHTRQVIKPIYSTEEVFSDEVMNFKFPVGQGLTGAVIRDGKPRIQNWDDDTEIAVLIPGTTDVDESLLSVPLLAKNVVIGALTLYKINKKRFYEEQISTLTVFASQASSAIETSRLYMKLKESEKVYRSSVDMAGDSILFVDSDTGKITDINETGIRTFKYVRSEIVSKYIWELHPQPQMSMARQLWQSAVTDGQGTLAEIDYEAKDGTLIPASINASRIAAGDINFIQWIVRDISQYKENVSKIGFFHKILSGLGQPLLITDATGIICFFNTSFKRLFCLDDDSRAEGMSIKSLAIRDPGPAILESVWTDLKGKSSLTTELFLNLGQNNQVKIPLWVLPYYDECDNLTHYLWIFFPSSKPEVLTETSPAVR